MLDKDRLKDKLKAAFVAEQETETDPTSAIDRICDAMAQAIVEEIKNLKITYSNGLTAGTAAVTGIFNNTLS